MNFLLKIFFAAGTTFALSACVSAPSGTTNSEKNGVPEKDFAEENRGISKNREVGILKFVDPEKNIAVAQLEIFEAFPKETILVSRNFSLEETAILKVENSSGNSLGLLILKGIPSSGDFLVVPEKTPKIVPEKTQNNSQ